MLIVNDWEEPIWALALASRSISNAVLVPLEIVVVLFTIVTPAGGD